jgi:three-Cys-motif partner protein
MNPQRELPDDADEKWFYSDHTGAKHEILRRYLGAWLTILGRRRKGSTWRRPLLVILDGFAGRGRYMGDEDGSPKIMFDRAVEVVEAGLVERVLIGCSEPNEHNFKEHLREVCNGLKHEQVEIRARQETFEQSGTRLAAWAEKQHPRVPIFVTADPFGFSGVPFPLVNRLMKIDKLEVLLTFMARDMARFLGAEHVESPMTDFFGSDTWKECTGADNRAECLLSGYRGVVSPEPADYAISFRVFEDFKRTVLYYLVHLTNSDKGMREMKEAMVQKAGDMTFWPVTVHDPNQISIEAFETEQPPYPTLQKRLAQKYAGQSTTFLDLLNDDYPDDVWIEPQYREALKTMEKAEPPRAGIERAGLTRGGKPRARGVKHEDTLTIPSAKQ